MEVASQRRPGAEGRDYHRGDNFTEAEDAAFWPIYREYDLEWLLATAGRPDSRVCEQLFELTDAIAEKLATQGARPGGAAAGPEVEVFRSDQDGAVAAHGLRFLQVEHQLLLLIDLQISTSLPLP